MCQPPNDSGLLVASVGVVGTLAGAIAGGCLSYLTMKKQVHAEVVSKARHQWLNELRDIISLLLAKADISALLYSDSADTQGSVQQIYAYREEINKLLHKARLYLNMEKQGQKDLYDSIYELCTLLYPKQEQWKVERRDELQKQVIDKASALFAETWHEVKSKT